jgi:hypothetical protein
MVRHGVVLPFGGFSMTAHLSGLTDVFVRPHFTRVVRGGVVTLRITCQDASRAVEVRLDRAELDDVQWELGGPPTVTTGLVTTDAPPEEIEGVPGALLPSEAV